MKIAKQFAKEFLLPFVLALLWAVYSWHTAPKGENLMKVALSNFGASFFFIAWFTGQWNRISKQDQQFGRLDRIIADLQSSTKDIIGHTTGGDTYCKMSVPLSTMTPGTREIEITNCGDYASYDVEVTVIGLPNKGQLSKPNFVIGNLEKGGSRIITNIGAFDELVILFAIQTKAGFFIQHFELKKEGEFFYEATSVHGHDKVLYFENPRPDLFPSIIT